MDEKKYFSGDKFVKVYEATLGFYRTYSSASIFTTKENKQKSMDKS